MAGALEDITRDALNLSIGQRLALASLILESIDQEPDPEAEAAWEAEINGRIHAIDGGGVSGVPYDEVMRDADQRLAP
jgi:putative addiction module component (TIGR02574 family)